MEEHYLQQELYARIQTDPEIFEFLQSASLDGLWYWDLEKPENEWMNARFWEVLGYDPAEMPHLASAWQDIIDPDDLQLAIENFNKHCADPSHAYDQVVRYRHKQGHTVWVRCRGLAIRDASGAPVRMLGAHNEVTELKQTEQKLARSTDELVRSNEDLQRFAHAAAHDLKAPLRAMSGFSQLLERELGSEATPKATEYSRLIRDSARKMTDLIEGLLKYAHIGGSSDKEEVDVGELLDEVRDVLRAEFESTEGTLEAGALGRIVANRPAVLQVLLNLVKNSLTHSHRERAPLVRVELDERPDAWILSVSDNGLGIPPRLIEKVQRPFQTLPREGRPGGSGLGLALCQRALDNAGGHFEVESDGETGTTVRTIWPRT